MTQPTEAYLLAETLFYTFRGETNVLNESEIATSGIRVRKGHMTNVEGIDAHGEEGGVGISQRLSLGKTGIYYFSTVYGPPTGDYERKHISRNSEDAADILKSSLFMKALQASLEEREK